MRLAILGGSFNPVHNGHIALAFALRRELGFDRVLLIPANLPPHKALASGASAADRLAMLDLAVAEANREAGADFVGIEDCEIARGGVSYTIDTIEYLERMHSGELEGKIGLVMGQDLASGFGTWRRADELAERAELIIARREVSHDGATPPFPWRHRALENALLPISSSGIRAAIRGGTPWRSLVPDAVYRYIVERTLYES
ncbi:MAG TPA: nicotinate (nicotinamide) nucleotide adenylyltransferase [Treponemataceae bacterium]|nr:nicotinate (nicotinamide) nucleotide adenylyltransferase [Treponemataceae bacterium]HPS42883.1 nicotinate (nicotinamide) nucleotide adenylyltransferase [Treponemataceae bacterium]